MVVQFTLPLVVHMGSLFPMWEGKVLELHPATANMTVFPSCFLQPNSDSKMAWVELHLAISCRLRWKTGMLSTDPLTHPQSSCSEGLLGFPDLSMAGYSPQGHKESDTTEWLSLSIPLGWNFPHILDLIFTENISRFSALFMMNCFFCFLKN